MKKDKTKSVIIGGLIGIFSTLLAYYEGQKRAYNNVSEVLQKEKDRLTTENESLKKYLNESDKKVS